MRKLGFLKADSPPTLAFQEQGPTSSIIQHTSSHHSPQYDGMVVSGRVSQRKIKLLFVRDKRRKGKERTDTKYAAKSILACMHACDVLHICV